MPQTTNIRLLNPGAGYTATSASSIAIGMGSKSFTTQSSLAYTVGARVRASNPSAPSDFVEGLCTSYSGATLVINVDTVGGSGTFASWNINLAGQPGAGSQTPWLSDINAAGFQLLGTGNIGVGLTNPSQLLTVGQFSATSDEGIGVCGGTGIGDRLTLVYAGSTNAFVQNVNAAQVMVDASGSLNLSSRTNFASGISFWTNPGTASLQRMVITSAGNVGVGMSPSFQFQLSTDSAAKPSTSTWTVASDHRLKQNVEEVTDDSTAILGMLRWVRYQYNGLAGTPKGATGIGLIAQEVRPHLPEAVRAVKGKLGPADKEETELLGLDYHAILVHCARAIQQIDVRLAALEIAAKK